MARIKKKGKLSRKNKNIARGLAEEAEKQSKTPHSIIIHKGNVGQGVKQLQRDFRRVMEPNTASKLKERNKNTIKDFVSVSGQLNVSHLVIFTRSQVGVYLKMARLPRGPSLTFRLENYTLSKDLMSAKKQMTYARQFTTAPCLMTNLSSEEGENHEKLVCRMFLDMFPVLSPSETRLSSLQRSCLLHYDTSTGLYELRHYSIRIVPAGLSKAVKKLTASKKVPNLTTYDSINEFVLKVGAMSESEAEEDSTLIQVEQKKKKIVTGGSNKSAVKLYEIGPRITMKLVKIQEGLFDDGSTVLYHSHLTKTEEELLEIEKRWNSRRRLKEKRKKAQEENVKRKQAEREEHKQKCMKGSAFQKGETQEEEEYFEQEVGHKPDAGIFTKATKMDSVETSKKRKFDTGDMEKNKKRRFETDKSSIVDKKQIDKKKKKVSFNIKSSSTSFKKKKNK